MSDFLRRSGLDIKIEPKLNDDEIVIYQKLTGMANNMNQIAKRLNQGGKLDSDMLMTLKYLYQLINKIS